MTPGVNIIGRKVSEANAYRCGSSEGGRMGGLNPSSRDHRGQNSVRKYLGYKEHPD